MTAPLAYPLAGVDPADPTNGGFRHLEWNRDGAFHPGLDFNAGHGGDADCGEPVTCPEGGTVRAVVHHASGYGLHVWVETHTGRWLHFCHLQTAVGGAGVPVARGGLVGFCGKSAKGRAVWPYCHLHFEVKKARPPTWDYWPAGLSRAAVDALYVDPLVYLAHLAGGLRPVSGWTPYQTETGLEGRTLAGIVLHDTESVDAVDPHREGSWHYEIARDGTVYHFVDEADLAWQVRVCDRWWPAWLPRSRPYGEASEANNHTVGIELVSHAVYRDPGDDHLDGGPYTEAQYASTRLLLADLYARHGTLPVVGHGQLQRDRTDPVGFDYSRAGLWWDDALQGCRYRGGEGEEELMAVLNDEELFEVANKLWGELRGVLPVRGNGFYETWKDALRDGDYKGLPLSPELGWTGGTCQVFDRGLAVWKPDTDVSWEG